MKKPRKKNPIWSGEAEVSTKDRNDPVASWFNFFSWDLSGSVNTAIHKATPLYQFTHYTYININNVETGRHLFLSDFFFILCAALLPTWWLLSPFCICFLRIQNSLILLFSYFLLFLFFFLLTLLALFHFLLRFPRPFSLFSFFSCTLFLVTIIH